MMQGELEKLQGLEDQLHERVIGQDEAVTAVAAAVRRSRAGLSDPDRPIGSFFFLGPTGVGKTELAKALAECLFDDERALVRIDMSEYMEKFSVQRLIGAPPGYVGYDEGGQLTEAVRRRPYSVILLDEMEKAHPDVFNVLLQVLDDGRLTDGQGRQVSFKNTIIIMTSNVGSTAIAEYAGRDEAEMRHLVDEAMSHTFRPEFLNRIDDIVVFHPLGMAQIEKIVDIQLADVRARLAKERMTLGSRRRRSRCSRWAASTPCSAPVRASALSSARWSTQSRAPSSMAACARATRSRWVSTETSSSWRSVRTARHVGERAPRSARGASRRER